MNKISRKSLDVPCIEELGMIRELFTAMNLIMEHIRELPFGSALVIGNWDALELPPLSDSPIWVKTSAFLLFHFHYRKAFVRKLHPECQKLLRLLLKRPLSEEADEACNNWVKFGSADTSVAIRNNTLSWARSYFSNTWSCARFIYLTTKLFSWTSTWIFLIN